MKSYLRLEKALAAWASIAFTADAAIAQGRPAPEQGRWVAYNVGTGGGSFLPQGNGTGVVSQGGGWQEIIALRLISLDRRGVRAEFANPAGFDRRALRLRDLDAEERPADAYSRAAAAYWEVLAALRHHRPPVSLIVDPAGRATIANRPQQRAHRRCARDRLRNALEERVASAENAQQRESEAERLRNGALSEAVSINMGSSALLLGILQLDLPRTSGTSLAQMERGFAEERNSATPTNQYVWRSEQIRLYGIEAGTTIDLRRDTRSPAARICRSLRPARVGSAASDRCTIESIVDARDGWPIMLRVSRSVRTTAGAEAGSSRFFSRLAPLEGFAPPANPCASAARG